MPLYDQVELLCQAIGSQAKSEGEKIVALSRQEADRRVSEAETRSQDALARRQAEVEAQAKLTARNRIDKAELEGKRWVSQTKETGLSEVFAEVQARLRAFREGPDYVDWLRTTLAAAMEQLEGEEFQVRANPEEEKWLTPELLAEVGRSRGGRLDLAPDPELPPGGFILVRTDGRVRFDQTFTGIIDRQREALRAEAARRLWGTEESAQEA
jgi:vacuolar-type H+-ATPase subunit E/Vma4